MGKRFLRVNGKEVELDESEIPNLKEKFSGTVSNAIIENLYKGQSSTQQVGFGTIVEYNFEKEVHRGKVVGYNKKNNKFKIAVACGASRAGIVYSSTEAREVSKKDIVKILDGSGLPQVKRPNNG